MTNSAKNRIAPTSIRIQGMSCGHCVKAVAEALCGVEGLRVQSVDIGRADVDCSDSSVLGRALTAIEDAGFDAAVDPAPQ